MLQQKENFAAQLRGLRLLLGKDNKPVSGEVFSTLSGIPIGTLRSIENGLRKLNENDLRKIKNRLCAKWNPRKNRWVDARDGQTPYSRAIYERYSQAIFSEPHAREMDAEILASIIFYLLQKLPTKTYHLGLFEVHDKLVEIAKDYEAPVEVFELLGALAPMIVSGPDLRGKGLTFECVDYPKLKEAGKYVRRDGPGDSLRLVR
jgi:hypothetical protein